MSLRRALVALGLVPFGLGPAHDAQAIGRIAPERAEEVERLVPVVFEGLVADADGTPAEGAVVVTSAGGRAVTDRRGSYRLEVGVPADARSVEVTAVGGTSGSRVASTSVVLAAGSALARVGPLALASASTCQPSWLPTFGGQPGIGSPVRALTVFDDGSGPALYAGGQFLAAGGVAANHVAKWDGSGWAALGSGLNQDVLALAVFDDGSGSALYAGGSFTTAGGMTANRIAKWDGASWAALGTGMNDSVRALTVFDDGSGPALYVGGRFTTAGGSAANRIAKWEGSTWSPLGSGTNDEVLALTVFDDGGGPALYAGGDFNSAGGVAANSIASWDGSSWAALGSGLNQEVVALAVFDDGSGSALHAGGSFTTAGGMPASRIAKWDGASWTGLGSGIGGGIFSGVYALTVLDDGSGPALYAGGDFTTAGGLAASSIARWDGSSWAALGSGLGGLPLPYALALTAFDDGSGPALHAGGDFRTAGGVAASGIARWNGSSWAPLGSGINGSVLALTVFDDGSVPALHAGGGFTSAGGVAANRIARWDGSSWAPLGSGMGGGIFPGVHALTVFDDGSAPALHAGGDFTSAGGVAANRIARWDGSSWAPLGSGMNSFVESLAVFDDGSGPALYAGGYFTTAGGAAANSIARWDGASWVALGGGMDSGVLALTVFDDGSGPALYAGGDFTIAGGVAANRIAKWDGASWAPLGSGMGGGMFTPYVSALTVFDDGNGAALYAGGDFATAGGAAASRIAKWDGSTWSALGSGMSGGIFTTHVSALAVFDDGSGAALYAGGDFATAGGAAANRIAKWDGSTWSALGSGVNGGVTALTVFNDRTGPALHVGGQFTSAPDSGDSYLAKWGCPDTNPPTITCPPGVLVDDRRVNGSGEVLIFTVTVADEEDPTPRLECVPPSGSLFPPGTTVVTCTATDFAGNQSTCQFTVTVRSRLRDV